MTDLPAAIAALRAERDANASIGHEQPVSWFLVDAALAALDAAQVDVRQKVKDTLTDYLDHYPHPEFLDAVMAHLTPQSPPAQPRVERYGDGVLVHWPEGMGQYVPVGDCVTGNPPRGLGTRRIPVANLDAIYRVIHQPSGHVVDDYSNEASALACAERENEEYPDSHVVVKYVRADQAPPAAVPAGQ